MSANALGFEGLEKDRFFTEGHHEFLSLFKQCFKAQRDYDHEAKPVKLDSKSLEVVPHHLIFSKNLLDCVSARDNKIKLMHTLNTFRSIQRRLTLDLREMGTRDRVMGGAELIKPKENLTAKQKKSDN
jgi:hypothetical protein